MEVKTRLIRLGTNQKRGIMIVIIIVALIQFELLLTEDAGSKTENRFVIIFM